MTAEELMENLVDGLELVSSHQADIKLADDLLFRGLRAMNEAISERAKQSGQSAVLNETAKENFHQAVTCIETAKKSVLKIEELLKTAQREITMLSNQTEPCLDKRVGV